MGLDANAQLELFRRVAPLRRRGMKLLGIGAEAAEDPPPPPPQEGGRLDRLTRLFSLSPLEIELLVALVAVELEPLLRQVLRTWQRDAGRPWIEMGTLSELLGLPRQAVPDLLRLVRPDGALRRWALVYVDPADENALVPPIALKVKVADSVADYLAGYDVVSSELRLISAELAPSWHAPPRLVERLAEARSNQERIAVEVTGPSACTPSACANVAAALREPLYLLSLGERSSAVDETLLVTSLMGARRDVRLLGGMLCVQGWRDAALPRKSGEERANRFARPFRRLIDAISEPLFFADDEPEPLLAQELPVLTVRVQLPSPSVRAEILENELWQREVAVASNVDLRALTRRFALDPRRLRRAAAGAVEHARLEGRAELEAVDLTRACQAQLSHDLSSVAQRVATGHRWEDLVIPEEVYEGLGEMVAYVRHARRVYDEWGFGARHSLPGGVSALFSGPPGTGKTMCAAVIARELDMELFRVDLSRIVSKWVGETEKNLARLFDEAEQSNAIVLFDEADSLFAKRTEVKSSVDRYANLEVNFLLQRMEAFRGVTILTSNLEDTIDAAFKRRLSFRLRFERPDREARESLWSKVFPEGCELAEDVDPFELARLDMSGANIRNAALRAAFLAAAAGTPISMHHCLEAAERECRELGALVFSLYDSERPYLKGGHA